MNLGHLDRSLLSTSLSPRIVICALLLKEVELIRETRALLAPRYVQAVIRLMRMTAVAGGSVAHASLLVENERLLMADCGSSDIFAPLP